MRAQTRRLCCWIGCLFVCLSVNAQERPRLDPWQMPTSTNWLPHFEPANGRQILFVEGRPFAVLAVEIPWWDVTTGDTYTVYDYLYPAAKGMGLNALKVPIKWSLVEPEQGVYDFSYVDHVKATAEKHGLKLVLNWFGHYASNDGTIYGNLTGQLYAPAYIVEDEKNYPRAVDGDGVAHHNAASYEYDAIIQRETAAFRAFMEHIKKIDSETHTIVMVQVENEIAVFGWDRQNRKLWRDHSPAGNRLFSEKGFTDDLKYSAWRLSSNWIARITEAGAQAYPLPFFHNYVGGKVAEWMVGGAPGEDVATSLESCPRIAFIGVNLYVSPDASVDELRAALLRYRVGRNLPAITETNSGPDPVAARLAFLAVGEFGAPIIAPWALSVSYPAAYAPYVQGDGTLANGAFGLRDAYSTLGMAISQISYYAATDKLKVFMARVPGQKFSQTEDVNGLRVTVNGENNGQAIVIHPSEHEFLFAGYRSETILHSDAFRWPTLKTVHVERGYWSGNQWQKQGEPLHGFDQSKNTLSVDLDVPQVVRVFW